MDYSIDQTIRTVWNGQPPDKLKIQRKMLERQKQKELEQRMNFNVEQTISEWITHYSEVLYIIFYSTVETTIEKSIIFYSEFPKFNNNVMVWTPKRCKK